MGDIGKETEFRLVQFLYITDMLLLVFQGFLQPDTVTIRLDEIKQDNGYDNDIKQISPPRLIERWQDGYRQTAF